MNKLSPVYTMDLSNYQSFRSDITESAHEFVKDTDNPLVLTRNVSPQLKLLSKVTGFDRINLAFRIVDILKQISPEEELQSSFEKNTRSWLEEINLKYSFVRPRTCWVIRAFLHMVQELAEANKINAEYLSEYFIFEDETIDLIPVREKPDFVQKVRIDDSYFSGSEEWLDDIVNCKRLEDSVISIQDHYVIGELSEVTSLEWGSPQEMFMSQLIVNEEKDHWAVNFFGLIVNRKIDAYLDTEELPNRSFFILRNKNQFMKNSSKASWIAFNPILAAHLGWEPEDSKLFAWQDEEGDLMVESIYWQNGNPDMLPRHDSETGQGWYVLASQKAIAQIRELGEELALEQRIVRSYNKDGFPIEKKFYKKDEDPFEEKGM